MVQHWFSVCSVVETFLGRFSWNFTSLTYQFISHINPYIFGKWQDVSAWNFLLCLEIISVCSGSSNSTTETWYLVMDCDTWLTKNSQFPNLVAAHQAAAAHRLSTADLDSHTTALMCMKHWIYKSCSLIVTIQLAFKTADYYYYY